MPEIQLFMINSRVLSEMIISDSHNHLHFKSFNQDVDIVINRSHAAGVFNMLLVGIDPEDSERASDMSFRHKGLFSSIGIHPQNADKYHMSDMEKLKQMAHQNEKIVAVGETGFDLFHTPDTYSLQKDFFIAHIDLAKDLSLPLIIHDREAHRQTIEVLDEYYYSNLRGVFHCFSGDVLMARHIIDFGFLISIPGVVTYKNAPTMKDVVKFCPLDCLLVETDAPFLAPAPFRGKRNEPSYLLKTIEEIARIKNYSVEDVCNKTTENFKSLFSISNEYVVY